MKPQNGENGVNGMNGVMTRKGEGMNGSHSQMMAVGANGGKGVRTQELVRLMVQSMHDMGYSEAAAALERESGFMLETPSIRQFREGVLTGDWQLVETLLSVLELDQDKDALEIKFLIRQQKYLELLEGRNIKKALQILRNELTPLDYSLERLHALSSLMMYADVADLKKRADWDGAGGMSRQKLLLDLQKYISPSIMVPERRLETLLKQAMTLQLKNCLYHNSEDESITLFSDHVCDRAQFPCMTTNILEQHADEVWYVAFSHDGRYLASVSKDTTCIIWSMENMKPYRHLTGHTMDVAYCAWSPDDTMLLTCGTSADDNLRLWEVSVRISSIHLIHVEPRMTGVCVNILRKHDDQVTSCAWLPDGEQFVSGDMVKNIYLWSTDGNVLHKWSGPRVTDLAINGEGTRMYAICNEKKIWAYDLVDRSAQALWTIQETGPLTSICLSLDGRFALINLQAAQELHLWDLENKILAHKYVGHTHVKLVRVCMASGARTTYRGVAGSQLDSE
ncbi:hypothetical protein BC937DRAFT_90666 [Endogone sp. FLAS-F59071]|nr:hypothetical protein BC937DRAFT_90666 [Endogone sp. FLAS-F59071]|eukprot:RUS16901.1 hypothetical protein BC937DRAFT_90666 [Endogone sp. FLAS-F59071]